jgi:hypothetical protein
VWQFGWWPAVGLICGAAVAGFARSAGGPRLRRVSRVRGPRTQ